MLTTSVGQAEQLLDCKRSFLSEAGGGGLVARGGADLVVAPHPLTLGVQHLGFSSLSQFSLLTSPQSSLSITFSWFSLLNYLAD